jgi:hypothetical protein
MAGRRDATNSPPPRCDAPVAGVSRHGNLGGRGDGVPFGPEWETQVLGFPQQLNSGIGHLNLGIRELNSETGLLNSKIEQLNSRLELCHEELKGIRQLLAEGGKQREQQNQHFRKDLWCNFAYFCVNFIFGGMDAGTSIAQVIMQRSGR